jgi:hypothetical protein
MCSNQAIVLVEGSVELETIRKRLGHKNMQTRLCSVERADKTSDAERRAWRRRKKGR